MNSNFFNHQTNSSRIKASIIADYFPQYCKIINTYPQKEIRYLDLFAGPGIYKDGSHSTPMLLGKEIANHSILKNIVRFLFNDNEYSEELKRNFNKHFPEGTFKFEPRFASKTVGNDDKIYNFLTKEPKPKNPHPTLLFFDPWGYKGIDTIAIAKFLRNWGNEVFLFVNIKRIHAAIENKKFDNLMNLLFPTTIDSIKKERRYTATVHERLSLIMDKLADEFKNVISDKFYHTSFKFQEEDSNATSHFIIHFTKHPKGYELVKQIFNEFDNIGASLEKDGNYTFDAKKMNYKPGFDFNFSEDNINALSEKLAIDYKGRLIYAGDLFREHHVSTKFCASHYSKALRKLVAKGKVTSRFNDNKNHRVTVLLQNNCLLNFN